MRYIRNILLAGAALWTHPALAADALKFGGPPVWVHPQPIPGTKTTNAPIAMLLNDQQVALERGKSTTFSEVAVRFENAQGLGSGNVTLIWQPATDTVTVNKLQIHRGDKVIDVLAGGQTFTVLRRETNLDAATLDGTLTATLQPEGLQVGDIIDFATTIEHSDAVLKGHVESFFGGWNALPVQAAHASLRWPNDIHLFVRQTPNLPSAIRSSSKGTNLLEISGLGIEPLVPPKGAPARLTVGRLGEATDFATWADLADLFIPLFRDASTIPASGPLHDEVERIRGAAGDPKSRTQQALTLVQDRVRYVALLMGQGGYVPSPAEMTWSRRFGDCKAKTALLLGILRSLGIEAEPVLVQSTHGDVIADRLPMISLFDHVLVRAHIGGKVYWLDGTRTGDTDLDSIEVPNFGWGLPVAPNARLVQMVPSPLDTPDFERHVTIDASSGIYSSSPVTITEIYRRDSAVRLNMLYSLLTADQRDQQLRDEAKTYFDTFATAASSLEFDKSKRELQLTIRGSAKLNWKDGWFNVPTSSIAFDPDFDRPAGPLHDAPWAIAYPTYLKDEATIKLPAGFTGSQKLSTPVHETLAGVEYTRSESINDDSLVVASSERSVTKEIEYKDALAAAPRIRALDKDDVYLRVPSSYHLSAADVLARAADSPTSASGYFDRGLQFLNSGEYGRAVADFDQAQKLDPKDAFAFADRAFAYAYKGDYEAASRDVAAAQALDATNPVAQRAAGLVAERRRDFKGAIAAYSASLVQDPKSTFAIGRRAYARYGAIDKDGALADAELALKSDPTWMDLRLLRANIFLEQGKRDLAIGEARLLTAENPHSSYAYVAAGRIYGRLSHMPEAMNAFDAALAMKPEAFVYVNRAQARPFTDKAGRLADLDAALKLEPNNRDALAEKAEQLAVDGDSKGALQLYDQVIKAVPDEKHYRTRRAALLFKTGNEAASRKLFADLRADAKSASDFNSLCWAKATAGILLEVALDECREALKREPDTGSFLDSLALVELRLGSTDAAIADYTRAISKGTQSSFMGRALAYSRKGDKGRASADLAQALQFDPNAQVRFAEFGLTFGQNEPPKASQAPSH